MRGLAALHTRIRFQGSRDVDFAHTAYDLALSTGTLGYLPRDLAFAVADVYLQQQAFENIQDAFRRGVFQSTTFYDERAMAFGTALGAYMGDVTYQEPRLLALYARLLPRLDSAAARMAR